MNVIKIVRIKNRIKLSHLISGFALIFFLAGTILPASAAGVTASREMSTGTVYAGGTFTVSVHIKADEHVEALALDENLPEGWALSRVGNDGAIFQDTSTFKASTQEWIWVENLSTGEEKTVTYYVTVPPTSKLGVSNISGIVSAYSIPAAPVGGSSAIIVNSPLPNSDFSAAPLSGPAPLTVQFTDLSSNGPNSWEWDFDGNGVVDSTVRNPLYTYENPGIYSVTLRASNGTYGSNIETRTGYIIATEMVSSSGGSGGSGGGGGGGGSASPESSKNIALKEIANEQVFKGIHTCYIFKGGANDIVRAEFDPKKSFGKTTAIVEVLKNTSSIVKEPAPGKVYKNINLWIGNSGFSKPENLENARIDFRVNKIWISENDVDKSKITLYRYSGNKWNSLSTILNGEDTDYFYFTSETPGFSPFAISSPEKSVNIENLEGKNVGNPIINKSNFSEGEQEGSNSNNQKEEHKSLPDIGFVLAAADLTASYAILKRRK